MWNKIIIIRRKKEGKREKREKSEGKREGGDKGALVLKVGFKV